MYIYPHFSSSLFLNMLHSSSIYIYIYIYMHLFVSIHFSSSFSLTRAYVSPWILSWLQSWFVASFNLSESSVIPSLATEIRAYLFRHVEHKERTSNFLMDWTFQVILRHCISCRKADTLSFFCFCSLLPIVSSFFCTPIDLCSCFFSLTLCFSCILVVSRRAFHQDSLLFGSASSSSFLFIPLIPLHSLPCSSFWSFPSSLHWTQSFRTSYRQYTNTSR